MMASRSRKKQGQLELMRLAWRYGARKERFFALYIPLSPFASLFVALGFIAAGLSASVSIQVLLASLAVIGGWPSIMAALYDSVYSREFHRQALEQGWVSERERPYYLELMRFRAAYGSDGHSPSQMKWGFAYAAVYLILAVAATPTTLLLYPILGGTAFVAVLFSSIFILLALGVAYSARVQRMFRQAEAKGFRLRELRRAVR